MTSAPRRLFDRLAGRHWRAVDALRGRPNGCAVGPDAEALITLIVSGFVLIFMQYVVLRGPLQEAASDQIPELLAALGFADLGAHLARYRALIRNATWALGCSFFYLVLPAVVIKVVFRQRLRDWGLNADGYLRHLWIYALLFVPVAIAVFFVSAAPGFQHSYPFYKTAHGWTDLLVWEAFYALQFFCLEFFFRGFMVRGTVRKYGTGAVFFMVLPYCMIHFQKPFLETTGAVIAGLVLGVLALRTRSIMGGFTIHVAVALSMDFAALARRGALPG